jgi:Carboxypeptidase regulatory-like domain
VVTGTDRDGIFIIPAYFQEGRMRQFASVRLVSWVAVVAVLIGSPAAAQQRASIVGLVSDSTGAVLPGVTVEASSPALIERVRTVVTDSAGRYSIVDLRPGTYAVTFELQGFSRVRREGIELEGAFAAQVNASLSVGAVAETITVTGASPVVDVQSTQAQAVLSRDVLDVLPAARTMQGGASLVPGVAFYSQGFTSNMSYHGSLRQDQHIYFDGMNIGQNLTQQGQQANGVGVNELAQEELVYDTGSQSTEFGVGGVRMDSIPKEGGNRFSGTVRLIGSNSSMQNDNVTDKLRPFINQGNRLDHSYEFNSLLGGPIQKDRLWFLVAQRVSQTNNLVPLPKGVFPKYPSGADAESGGAVSPHSTVRLTGQLSPRNKVTFAFYKSSGGTQRFDVGCTATSFNSVSCISPEASYWLPTPLQYAAQAKWTSPVTSRMLLEVGQSFAVATYKFKYQPENGPLDIQNFNRSTSVRTVNSATAPNDYFSQVWNAVANLSYVTGSHNYKVGVNQQWGWDHTKVERNGDMSVLTFVNVNNVPQPSTATLTNSPYDRRNNLNSVLGVYAQDKWTLPNLTVTYGGRWDYFNASAPAQSATGGRFMSAAAQAARANIDPVSCTPCWNEWSVRGGASYDVFGNGKTALKTSIGKFIAQEALGTAASVNPLNGQSDSRAWTDLDKNGTIFDANGNVQFAELGASTNNRFGLPGGGTQIDPNLPRGTNWEETVSVQHELIPRMSVTGGFYHRTFQHVYYTKNTLVDPKTDFTTYTITVPANTHLPSGGGDVITMYNLIPSKLGQTNNVRTWTDNNTRVYNGYEVSVNGRLPKGFLFGGITWDRTATNDCTDLANSHPNNLRFCQQTPPLQPLYKASGGYRLPYAVQISGSFQARPGIPIGSYYTFNSAVAGVALTGGGNITVTVVDPTARYYDYVKTNDIRLSRVVRVSRTRIEPFVEIFNLLNLSTVTTVNENIGPNYLDPGSIVQGRRLQLGARLDW